MLADNRFIYSITQDEATYTAMGIEEARLGRIILACGCIGFAYYSVWVLTAPFLDDGSSFSSLFPPKHLATSVPIYIGLAIAYLVVFNIGWSLIQSQVEAHQAQASKSEKDKQK